jgi:gluconokinase
MTRLVVMGVSGCGKSGLGLALAQALTGRFVDGDDLHTNEARAMMGSGTPLTDADRAPWLDRVGHELTLPPAPVIIACSALKRAYRDRIRGIAGPDVLFLHLDGPRDVIAARMAERTGHYMPPALLNSQIAILEPPASDEPHLTLDLRRTPDQLLADALAGIRAAQR